MAVDTVILTKVKLEPVRCPLKGFCNFWKIDSRVRTGCIEGTKLVNTTCSRHFSLFICQFMSRNRRHNDWWRQFFTCKFNLCTWIFYIAKRMRNDEFVVKGANILTQSESIFRPTSDITKCCFRNNLLRHWLQIIGIDEIYMTFCIACFVWHKMPSLISKRLLCILQKYHNSFFKTFQIFCLEISYFQSFYKDN